MHGWAAPKLPFVRIGVVGMGGRGCGVLGRTNVFPNVAITAICDNDPGKIARAKKMLADSKRPAAKEYLGEEAYRALCEDPNVDVVYNTTPWNLHVPVQLAAMKAGKHVFTEVPSAFTVDECWELVETSEKTRRHCMQLENCLYDEVEMLTFNLAKLGMLGDIVHAEGAYIHDLRWMCKAQKPSAEYWRFDENRDHGGNRYPTHGLVPVCMTMDVNRGDRLEYLVSVDSARAGFEAYMKENLKADDPRRTGGVKMSDMNSTLIKTANGKSILLQHDVSSPRPYSRIQLVSGTKGAVGDYPFRCWFDKWGMNRRHKEWWGDAGSADPKARENAENIRQKYMHPLRKTIGETAKRIGGHGGMDSIMDARWIYCLQQGLPLDTDVYDLATYSSIVELSERSVNAGSRPIPFPDYTRGGWKTAKPFAVEEMDIGKFNFARGVTSGRGEDLQGK